MRGRHLVMMRSKCLRSPPSDIGAHMEQPYPISRFNCYFGFVTSLVFLAALSGVRTLLMALLPFECLVHFRRFQVYVE